MAKSEESSKNSILVYFAFSIYFDFKLILPKLRTRCVFPVGIFHFIPTGDSHGHAWRIGDFYRSEVYACARWNGRDNSFNNIYSNSGFEKPTARRQLLDCTRRLQSGFTKMSDLQPKMPDSLRKRPFQVMLDFSTFLFYRLKKIILGHFRQGFDQFRDMFAEPACTCGLAFSSFRLR